MENRKRALTERPETTLFSLVSVDGKITAGDTDVLDTEPDFPRIKSIKEGLHQYYGLDQQTDLVSLNSGRVMKKVGVNEKSTPEKIPVDFIIIDNKPHLTSHGVDYLMEWTKKLYLVTTNKNHPAFERQGSDNLEIILYENTIDFADLFSRFKQLYGVDRITIQSGGTLNAVLLREKLLDHISLVMAPALIGGENTSSLIDGESLHSEPEFKDIKALKLKSGEILKDSYLHLQHDVINETVID